MDCPKTKVIWSFAWPVVVRVWPEALVTLLQPRTYQAFLSRSNPRRGCNALIRCGVYLRMCARVPGVVLHYRKVHRSKLEVCHHRSKLQVCALTDGK